MLGWYLHMQRNGARSFRCRDTAVFAFFGTCSAKFGSRWKSYGRNFAIPEDGEAAPWWTVLAAMETERRLSVCARLPFVPMAVDRRDAALCVAKIEADHSGDDKSFFVLHTSAQISRTRLQEAITAAGITLLRLVGINEQLEDRHNVPIRT